MKSKPFLTTITLLFSLLLWETSYAKKPYSIVKRINAISKIPSKTTDLIRDTKFVSPQTDTGE